MTKLKLYQHQIEGVEKFINNKFFLNEDDMGLGKTCQAIVALERLFCAGKIKSALVISPATIKYVWETEIVKFTGLTYTIIEGTKSERIKQWESTSQIKVVNYELILRDEEYFYKGFDVVILDEAHRLKNYKSKIGEKIKFIPRVYRWAMTGTPIVNQPTDIHSIFEFLHPFYLGHHIEFREKYMITERAYYYKWQDKKRIRMPYTKVIGYKNLDQLNTLLKAVSIRRLKTEALPDLPEKIITEVMLKMTEKQQAIYDRYDLIFKEKMKRNEMILGELSKLRFICDGILVNKKTDENIEIPSIKLIRLSEILDDSGISQVVVFTNWIKIINIIKKFLDTKQISYLEITGRVDKKTRALNEQKFKEGQVKIMLCTSAAEEGINLWSANILINFDVPWTKSALKQRSDRVHRMGQIKKTLIYNFYCKDTIEERIKKILDRKDKLAVDILDKTDKGLLI